MTASTVALSAMPKGLSALFGPPVDLLPLSSSLLPAQAASAPASGAMAAAASAPLTMVRRSRVLVVFTVRVPFVRWCISGVAPQPVAVGVLEAVVVLVPVGDVGREVDRRDLARSGDPLRDAERQQLG